MLITYIVTTFTTHKKVNHMKALCKDCGDYAVQVVLTPDSVHYGKLVCMSCGVFHGWEPKPFDPEKDYDENFTMPFGKHKGRPIKDFTTVDLLGYLRWLRDNTELKGKMKNIVELHLKKNKAA